MELAVKLYYNTKIETPRCDLGRIFFLLDQLNEKGIEYQTIDTADYDEDSLSKLYIQAVMPAVWKHYRVRHIFGTRNRRGKFFGREQPALLVYKGNIEYPEDIYPHEKEGEKIPIEDYLEQILVEVEKQNP